MANARLIKKALKRATPEQLIRVRALLGKIMELMDILPGNGDFKKRWMRSTVKITAMSKSLFCSGTMNLKMHCAKGDL